MKCKCELKSVVIVMKFMSAFYQLLETCLLNWNILYWKDPFVVLELNKI